MALSEKIVSRFRSVSVDRLMRIEVAWTAIRRGRDRSLEPGMLRDVHTLKGDAGLVGMESVGTLAQKLEDMIFAAKSRDYAVSDEMDTLVMMAVQFGQLYVRTKQPGSAMDLSGFVAQIDSAIDDLDVSPSSHDAPADVDVAPASDTILGHQTSALATVATSVFLECLRAEGAAKVRLRRAWELLARELTHLESEQLAPLMVRAAAGAADLGRTLGKEIDVHVDAGDVRAPRVTAEALQVTLVHLLRNALDHGIEAPSARAAANKPPRASIQITARADRVGIEVRVSDDGQGVDLDRVRAVAIERALLTPDHAAAATPTELLDLLFTPGFTTRSDVSETSGRGIGLDAVRAELARIGGTVNLETVPGAGSTAVLRVPRVASTLDVWCFSVASAGASIEVAIPASWEIDDAVGSDATRVDVFEIIELEPSARRMVVALAFRCGDRSIIFAAETSATRRQAARRWTTAPEDRVEIVRVEGRDVPLLRL